MENYTCPFPKTVEEWNWEQVNDSYYKATWSKRSADDGRTTVNLYVAVICGQWSYDANVFYDGGTIEVLKPSRLDTIDCAKEQAVMAANVLWDFLANN